MTKKKKQALPIYREALNDFPHGYDAHRDGFSEPWDHEESVNKLLLALRAAVEKIDAMEDKVRQA